MHIDVIGNGMILKTQWIGYTNQEGASAIQRIGVIRNKDTWEPVQYGPAPDPVSAYSRFMESVISELHGMDPNQECEGCMAGYHPSLLMVRESGSVMCAECCAMEDGD